MLCDQVNYLRWHRYFHRLDGFINILLLALTSGHPWPDLPGGGIAGALTRTGLLQTFQLGTELRRRYVDERTTTPGVAVGRQYLLPARWSNDTSGQLVQVRSTKTRRTVESARGVLSGLYPEAARDTENRMKVQTFVPSRPSTYIYVLSLGKTTKPAPLAGGRAAQWRARVHGVQRAVVRPDASAPGPHR